MSALRFPQPRLTNRNINGMGNVHFRVDKHLTAELRDWCRREKTTLVLSVFTAFTSHSLALV